MGFQETALLSTLRISKTVSAIVDPRLIPGDLRFLKRTPITPTVDGEILARVLNQALTADVIVDDQASHVYAAQRVQFELNHIPKIKIGMSMTESMIQLFNALKATPTPASADINTINNYRETMVTNVIRGVQQRMEALIVAMNTDQVAPSYSRLGILFGSDVSWGMWSDLKVVAGVAWSDPVNATPVNDIWGLKLVGSTKYGKNYDRLSLSTAGFREMIATAEFQAKAKLFVPAQLASLSYSSYLPLANIQQQVAFAQNIIGMEIELDDARHPQPQSDGTQPIYTPYLPLNLAVLGEKSNDNNPNIMDWGNTMPAETMMGDAPGLIGGGFPTPQYGPVSYAALANPALDPPGYNVYGVARGFPRKFDRAATACLNIGTVADILTPTINFGT